MNSLKDRVTAIESNTETSASVTTISDRVSVLESKTLEQFSVAGNLDLGGRVIKGVINDGDAPDLSQQACNYGSMMNYCNTKVSDT